ncbi:hypothetical protein DIPPA_26637 [Diplonema papillatum]|nr:hypothetical protein DIPPA_26637 [Diplonema papillatum]
MEVLETQLTTARVQRRGVADDLFPTYGGGRAERAARWAVFNATEHEKWSEQVCHEHQVKAPVQQPMNLDEPTNARLSATIKSS